MKIVYKEDTRMKKAMVKARKSASKKVNNTKSKKFKKIIR